MLAGPDLGRGKCLRLRVPNRLMRGIALAACSFLTFVPLDYAFGAQSAAGASDRPCSLSARPDAFDVATIKPQDPNGMHLSGTTVEPGGRVRIGSVSLRKLVAIAYGLSYWQVIGGDRWVDTTLFDIEAKPPSTNDGCLFRLQHSVWDIEDPALRTMLQSLLAERFHLRTHRETNKTTVYKLERKGDLRLRSGRISPSSGPSKSEMTGRGDINFMGGDRWFISNMSMAQLAKTASEYVVHRPVSDDTHLAGVFEYDSREQAMENDTGSEDFTNSFTDSFMRLLQRVGLTLKPDKGTVDTIVIDMVEMPLPN